MAAHKEHARAILGIDTHKHVHAAMVLDDVGRRLDGTTFCTNDCDHAELLVWARSHGPVRQAGVESTGSYGYRLARYLSATAVEVVEGNRPDRARRRRLGKSDLIDAETAARAVPADDARQRSPRIVLA